MGFDSYLKGNLSSLSGKFEEFLQSWRAKPTDEELEAAVVGDVSTLISRFRAECTAFVGEQLSPIFRAAIKDAVAPIEREYSIYFDFEEPYIANCVERLKRRLINTLVSSQRRAIEAVKGKLGGGLTGEEVLRAIRLTLGLNARNAVENWRFQRTVIKVWYPANRQRLRSGTTDDYALLDALERLARQAKSIAESALSLTYHIANHELARFILGVVSERGWLVDGFEKVWCTASDEKVCRICGGLDGKVFAFDEKCFDSAFSTGIIPPAHINCRCRVRYRQVALPGGFQWLDFEELSEYVGKMSSGAVRAWYNIHDTQLIHSRIDGKLPIMEKARRAFELRNLYRTQARDLMGDQLVGRAKLDRKDPNKEWEWLIADKMARKGMTREEAIEDIYRSATTPNKEVNRRFGIE